MDFARVRLIEGVGMRVIYVFLIIFVVGFIWFVLRRMGKGYYKSKSKGDK
jgi:cbb3-type cytochrome oxidase subunit 3